MFEQPEFRGLWMPLGLYPWLPQKIRREVERQSIRAWPHEFPCLWTLPIKCRWFANDCTISGCKRVCTGAGLPCLPICNKFHEKNMQRSPGWTQIGPCFQLSNFGKPLSQQIHTRYPIMMLMIGVLASSPTVENHHHHHHHRHCHHHHHHHQK